VVKLGIIGAGIMGGNHARVLRAIPQAQVCVVVDLDAEKGQRLADHIGASYESRPDVLPGRVDAAIVSTPAETHAEIAMTLIEQGLDVLIEKPIALTIEEAKELVAAARRHDRILMIGHVERFNPAVIELSRHVDGLIHVDIRRIGPFTSRITTDVVLDLMIHDVDLVNALVGSEPMAVLSMTRRVWTRTEDMATCFLAYPNGVSATLTASRASHTKQRQVELTQRDNVVMADLIRQQVTIHRLEQAEIVDDRGARYRQSGIIEIPYLEHQGEPLLLEQKHFIDCVLNRTQPMVGGEEGLAALATALRIRDEAMCLG
jgi:UDP-N-acetylglucosamine 3-dehydrogenase